MKKHYLGLFLLFVTGTFLLSNDLITITSLNYFTIRVYLLFFKIQYLHVL